MTKSVLITGASGGIGMRLAKAMISKGYRVVLHGNKHMEAIASRRKTLVSTGDRSAKVRTYNFPQSRLTDHRIGLTVYNLPEVMNGEIDDIMKALQVAENAERLKDGETR